MKKANIQFAILLAVVTLQAVACRDESYYYEHSKELTAKLQIEDFIGKIDAFHFDMSRFPTTAEGLDALIHNPGNIEEWGGPYLKGSVPLDPWGRAYVYKCPGDQGSYDLYSLGRDGVVGGKGFDRDIHASQ
jgi:general secretion pathway protein G